ncbi:hypoxanthine/guanine phosphoribosyltransferase [Methanococcoides seepicolus]|uniref:Hypoxanthine/guanine phosphoribosyltransferase n=1 Tax=Methanococcoides seepicolus TaxID=2828780 RepID=A0A9E4ZHQ0_9EURY|nr:hypoxanthine/guanine phosphoribosyltransferase [Methanococcoides seepicolus]MCM1988050.1 purine phosphoribosyltransferase family protein [Methanococcoides seepicolus]
MLEVLQESLRKAPIVIRGEYPYFIHPISDGVPSLEPELLDEIADHMIDIAGSDYDRIVSIEAMGIPLATVLSMKTGKPMSIVRKRQYGLEGEVVLSQSTGYSKGELYINGVNKGENILVVDDVISTGGTLKALLPALEKMGAEICNVIVVISRGDGAAEISDMGYKVETLVKIDVDMNGVSILEVAGEQQ